MRTIRSAGFFWLQPICAGLGISQLGAVDLEKGTFIAFDREGYGNLYEEGIGWSNVTTQPKTYKSVDIRI